MKKLILGVVLAAVSATSVLADTLTVRNEAPFIAQVVVYEGGVRLEDSHLLIHQELDVEIPDGGRWEIIVTAVGSEILSWGTPNRIRLEGTGDYKAHIGGRSSFLKIK